MRSYQDTLESWRESLDVNGAGVFALSRAFLGSEAARYITGQNIILDGGYTC
jgi:NAD(P)-dependent dehydrogenase (short-subunit alcohol dehydrogenase family)